MSLYVLDRDLHFPDVEEADEEGLLAIGGDLSEKRLLLAYTKGIFPWYQGEDILWWSPDPRFVLYPEELRISRSMNQLIRKGYFDFSVDKDFQSVISHCKTIGRRGQDGTWITNDIQEAYCRLHALGFAHSAEARKDGRLVGGLYGVRLGKVFFGESMFSQESNASKFAFIKYVELLKDQGVALIDCQVYTEHLESLGSRMIPRKTFVKELERLTGS